MTEEKDKINESSLNNENIQKLKNLLNNDKSNLFDILALKQKVKFDDKNEEMKINNDIWQRQYSLIFPPKDSQKISKPKISQLNMVDSSNFNKDYKSFSMISSNASKGNALKILANYLNIPMKNTIAIGNDKNDISMIKMAEIGVAVANATDDLKKYAKVITDSNDEDGVANYLEKLLKD